MSTPLPSTSNVTFSHDSWEEGTAPVSERVPQQRSEPPQASRWWFAFDRWLVVPDANDDFVLA